MGNTGSKVKSFFQSIPQKIATFGNSARNVVGKVGNGISTFANGAKGVVNKINGLPVIGDVMKALPYSGLINTGLDIGSGIGDTMSKIGNSDYSGALQSGIKTAGDVDKIGGL